MHDITIQRMARLASEAAQLEAIIGVPARAFSFSAARRPASRLFRRPILRITTVLSAAAAILFALSAPSRTVAPAPAAAVAHHKLPAGDAHIAVKPALDFTRLMRECMRADADCDGVVTASDIGAFLLALTNPERYDKEYPDCDVLCSADLSCDGILDDDDIAPLITLCLTGT